MLEEARKNCNKYSIGNVSLLKSDDTLSSLDGCFDLIHSYIVFQHIPIERGRHLFTQLLKHIKEGGIGAIQVTYSKVIFEESYGVPPAPSAKSLIKQLCKEAQRYLRSLEKIVDRLIRSPVGCCEPARQDPEMQMNPYNINELFFILQSMNIHNIHVEFTDHGGEFGIFLYFQKSTKEA